MEQNDSMESENNAEMIEADPLEILSDLCRVCGKSNDQMIPLFETHEYQLADKINKYLPITVTEQDALPLRACVTCAVAIIQWHTLFGLCIKANEKILRLLKEQHQVEQLDENQCLVDRVSLVTKIKVHQPVKDIRSRRVQRKNSRPLPANRERRSISGSNCSIGPSTSNQFQQPKNKYPAITNSDYKNISEDEANDVNVATNEPINMTVNPTERSDNVKIINGTPERPVETVAKMKLLKIQKIRDLLKKAQVKIQGRTLYHCRKCIKNFSSHIDYVYHVKSHTRSEVIANECNICGKRFHAKPHLIKHMSKHHLKIRKLICKWCGKARDSPKKSDNDKPDSITESYMCNTCKDKENNRVVYTSETIFASIATFDEDCPKQCDNCKHFFPTESSLKFHVSERSCMRLRNKLQRITK